MGRAIGISRVDLTAVELRAAAGREKNGAAARRMLALAMVLDGADRKSAAETCGMVVRLCGTGCIAITPTAWVACTI